MSYVGFCPPGVVLPYAGSVAPEGWLLCDGSAISRSVYPALFTAISTTYGTGDGSTTFTLPDFRGVYPRGAGANGTANYGGVTGHTPSGGPLGSKGGQKTAKNGLTNANSSISSLSLNSSAVGGSATSGGVDHTHGPNTGQFATKVSSDFSGYAVATASGYGLSQQNTTSNASAFNHTHGLSATASGQSLSSSSVAAQTISGDTETTPAFLAVNYIIKI